jgi:5-formyltetrahydrofolate cyclo-ligase
MSVKPSAKSGAHSDRRRLRQRFRSLRRSLTSKAQRDHAETVARHAVVAGLPLAFQRFALYLGNDGELDPRALIARLLHHGKYVALPVLVGDRLAFYPYHAGARLARNRFGIPEPDTRGTQRWPLATIGVVFVPLVAFDGRGYRLGMGGGFYDRSLASGGPLLVGLAHGIQEADRLPAASWDVPMDAVLTEHGYRAFSPRGARFGTGIAAPTSSP